MPLNFGNLESTLASLGGLVRSTVASMVLRDASLTDPVAKPMYEQENPGKKWEDAPGNERAIWAGRARAALTGVAGVIRGRQ